ncbi:MAG TPA: hypothetical protein VHY57_04485, partial [Rhizomicrobium sp.]|nr:hypothetical protein [Rhizomicrobium sp.]
RRLYHPITKPTYILCGAAKSTTNGCAFIDEAEMSGREVKQTTIEDFISKRLGIVPTLLTTFPLTAANEQRIVFGYQPEQLTSKPTARWIVVLFFPGETKLQGTVNRLRVLIALERFFYADRLRLAECNLSTEGEVYNALVSNSPGAAIPTKPELWLINPATHH